MLKTLRRFSVQRALIFRDMRVTSASATRQGRTRRQRTRNTCLTYQGSSDAHLSRDRHRRMPDQVSGFTHGWHLASRSFSTVVSWLGTTRLAVVLFSVMVPFVISALLAFDRSKTMFGFSWTALNARWPRDAMVALGVPAAVWIALLVIASARIVLNDHRALLAAQDKIREFTKPPLSETAIVVPVIPAAAKGKVEDALFKVSDVMSTVAHDACEAAARIQRSYGSDIHEKGKADGYAKQAAEIFAAARRVNEILLGQSTETGMLKSGEPLLVEVMSQVVRPHEREIIAQFDGWALETSKSLDALRIVDSSVDRMKLFDPVLTTVTIPMNQWQNVTTQFCKLIDNANARIAEVGLFS